MSESELGYMQDDFDLPRWQTHNEPYNPYAQQQAQAQAAQQQQQQSQSSGLNPARITQASSAYSSDLTRSVSLGGPRIPNRRHHQPEDLEGAFSASSQSLYTPALSYNTHSTPTSPDLFFTSAPPPKRGQQGGSPMRTTPQAPQNSMLDPYTYPSSYDQRQTGYVPQSHNRSLSQQAVQIKSEGLSPSPQAFGAAGSTPSTPMTYMNPSQFYPDSSAPPEPPKQKRRPPGLQRVRDVRELTPRVGQRQTGRRMDSNGTYLSPLRQLTTNIVDTYHICNPQFRYESTLNPRRVLTKPSKPAHNEGYDNEDYDYILYVNDWLGAEKGHKYLILDILGQGTFGQVVKCQNMDTHEIVAVKVVKNKPAYFNQSMMEVTILEMLNNQCDPHDEHHILRLKDSFIHKSHLCLVFELLSSNLYELIKQNAFQGLSTQLVKVFAAQLLDALSVLKDARLIHCDLKPENILLKSLQSPQIKVIDFGSACHERQTVYTYIQSRFYRSPEVLLGLPYTAAIDMWSLGCIVVELFLGLPLFPGTSEYNQITRITEMLGQPPPFMMEMGKQTSQFFEAYTDSFGQKKWRLKSLEQYSREHNTNEQPGKQYFKATTLPEIIRTAPMPLFKSSRQGQEMERELNNREAFIDFCKGLLNLNPIDRWSPQQARLHPFITGDKFTKAFTAPQPQGSTSSTPPTPGTDPKRPYGGLVPSQAKGSRPYQSAEQYNQQLSQHQATTAAQAQAATQAANTYRNPYLTQQQQQQQPPQSSPSSAYQSQSATTGTVAYGAGQVQPPASSYGSPPDSAYAAASSYAPGSQAAYAPAQAALPPLPQAQQAQQQTNAHRAVNPPNPPSHAYYGNQRNRANTINPMDAVPPALARLQHMNQDVIAGRNALTPVLKRDEGLREWERRQQTGKAAAAQPYPQLEHLQQQAELAGASGVVGWQGQHHHPQHHPQQQQQQGRYQSSKLAQAYQPPPMVVDDERRNVVMNNVRSAAAAGDGGFSAGAAGLISSPPQAYTGGGGAGAGGSGRYAPGTFAQTANSASDMFASMQPEQYQGYAAAANRQQQQQQQASAQSFYGAGIMPSMMPGSQSLPSMQQQQQQQQRGLFSGVSDGASGNQTTQDGRKGGGMDVWS